MNQHQKSDLMSINSHRAGSFYKGANKLLTPSEPLLGVMPKLPIVYRAIYK